MQLKVDIQPNEIRLKKINDEVIRRLKNLEPANRRAMIVLDRWVNKNFQEEGGLHQNPADRWNHLSEYTIAKRKARGFSPPFKILQDRGYLRAHWGIKADNEKGVLRSGHAYSNFHQLGGYSTDLKRWTPPRKIIPSVEQSLKLILPVYEQYLKSAFSELK